MADEHNHEHEDDDPAESLDLELESQSAIFLEMRSQNLELLRIAAAVCGYSGEQDPLKPNDVKNALRMMWEVYTQFYDWVDPESAEADDEEDDEEDD